MDKQALIQEILRQLFVAYEEMGAERIDLNEFIISVNGDPEEIRSLMNKSGLIRFDQVRHGLVAAISERGINSISPYYFENQAALVLKHARQNGDKTTVSTALQISGHFQKAMDIGKYIKANNLALTQIARDDMRVYLH